MARGQSSIEYLVTYGWTLLAILAAVAMVWYLGIFNPSNLLGSGDTAKGFTFSIVQQKYSGTVLNLALGNTQGQAVNITGVTVGGVNGTMPTVPLNAGAAVVINVTGIPDCGPLGARYNSVAVSIRYETAGGLANKTDSGTISGACS